MDGWGKTQAPTSKLQRSSNDQAPKTLRATLPSLWLEVGTSLELGTWNLELMTLRTLIRHSLCFHWRAHLGVVLGAAVGSAALIGALVVGDSVRGSLRQRTLEQFGHVEFLLDGKDRTFTEALVARPPDEESARLGQHFAWGLGLDYPPIT